MRPFRIPAILLTLILLPTWLSAKEDKYYINVVKLDGTIMVERAKDGKKEALQTGETVERGDIVTVYEKSWVILKTPKGDLIGLDQLTTVTFEELFKGGPDRQVRMNLKKGSVFARSKNSRSRQSYFELLAGNVVASLQRTRVLMSYDPKKSTFEVQYLDGKITVSDPAGDQIFPFSDCKRIWENGKLTQEDPLPLDEKEIDGFRRFWLASLPAVR